MELPSFEILSFDIQSRGNSCKETPGIIFAKFGPGFIRLFAAATGHGFPQLSSIITSLEFSSGDLVHFLVQGSRPLRLCAARCGLTSSTSSPGRHNLTLRAGFLNAPNFLSSLLIMADLAKTLVRSVVRAFNTTQETLVVDALARHVAMIDTDLGKVMKMNMKDLHRLCASLRISGSSSLPKDLR